MGEIDGAFRAWGFAKGGTGAISESIAGAARRFGAEIRLDATVAQVHREERRARPAWCSRTATRSAPTVVVSGLDPNRTFLKLVEPKELPDEFLGDDRAVQDPRLVGQGEPRARRAAGLHLPAGRRPAPARRDLDQPDVDYLERAYDDAKYGAFSKQPYMDIVIPSMIDPGMAPPGKHVMSIFVQYAPYDLNGGWTDAKREAFGDAVIDTLARVRAEPEDRDPHRQVLTPEDIEHITGSPRETSSRASSRSTSSSSCGRCPAGPKYQTPIDRLLAVRRRHAPGRRHHGRLRPARRDGHPAGRVTPIMTTSYDVIVIGSGLNELVAAGLLAKAGRKVLLLEGRATLGGAMVTEELAPGFRVDACSHDAGWLSPNIIQALELARHGLTLLDSDATSFTPMANGAPLVLWRDQSKTVESIRRRSPADAARWPDFAARMARLAGFLEHAYSAPPPRPVSTRPADLLGLAAASGSGSVGWGGPKWSSCSASSRCRWPTCWTSGLPTTA